MEEMTAVLDRPSIKKRFPPELIRAFLIGMRNAGTHVTIRSKVQACRDPKDNYLLALAKDGRADVLITGDKDLLVMETFEGVKIISPASFLRTFKLN